MITIQLLVVGTIKDNYLKTGIQEYRKRLLPYARVEIEEVGEETVKGEPGPAEIEKILEAEGKRIRDRIKPRSYVIALDIVGTDLSSEEFSELIGKVAVYNSSAITFVIGGSWGLSEAVKREADYRLSFSRMTFPHQLMRLIFLEQLYRAFMISSAHTYHK